MIYKIDIQKLSWKKFLNKRDKKTFFNKKLFITLTMQEGDEDKDKKTVTTEESFSPRIAILPVWRARCITPYNPELLPSEAVPLREEVSHVSLTSDHWSESL